MYISIGSANFNVSLLLAVNTLVYDVLEGVFYATGGEAFMGCLAVKVTRAIRSKAVKSMSNRQLHSLRRSAYPLGETPVINIEHPFNIPFETSSLQLQETPCIGKRRYDTGNSQTGKLNTSARLIDFEPRPEKAGTYHMEIEYQCSIFPWRRRVSPFNLLEQKNISIQQQSPRYRSSFVVPIEVIVADKIEAERVGYVSNPELDKATQAAFTSQPLSIRCRYGKRGSRLSATNPP